MNFLRNTILATCICFCASGASADIYSGLSRTELLTAIIRKMLLPAARRMYAVDATELSVGGVDWEDVAIHSASCQSRLINDNASQTDLEIIYFLWVKNAGRENRAARKVKKSLGQEQYTSAVHVFGNASFDCTFETSQYIDDLKSK